MENYSQPNNNKQPHYTMKSRYTIQLIAFAFAVITLASCGGESSDTAKLDKLKTKQAELAKEIFVLEKEIAQANPEAVTVRKKDIITTTLAPRKFDYFVQTQGMVQSEDNILVSAESMGVITAVFVKEGQSVRKGEVLAQIDNKITLRSIDEVKSGLHLATTIYEKQKNLWDQKIGTEVQFLQAKNNKESLEKRLATLNEQLAMTRIKSPINGTIEQVNVKIGQNAAPGAPAFRVINTTDLKIVASVSEAYVTNIENGDKVSVSFPDLNKEIEARVTFVGRNINPLSRSFPVEINLPSLPDLRPSMTAVLRVIYKTEPQALCVPINVVQEINGKKIVYVAEMDGQQLVARRKEIEVGGVFDNLAEVKSGLKTGDKVITVGYQGLNDGEFVKI
jgi:membrane fusion protein (multidrug efflux system)